VRSCFLARCPDKDKKRGGWIRSTGESVEKRTATAFSEGKKDKNVEYIQTRKKPGYTATLTARYDWVRA